VGDASPLWLVRCWWWEGPLGRAWHRFGDARRSCLGRPGVDVPENKRTSKPRAGVPSGTGSSHQGGVRASDLGGDYAAGKLRGRCTTGAAAADFGSSTRNRITVRSGVTGGDPGQAKRIRHLGGMRQRAPTESVIADTRASTRLRSTF
jgi:hypothetical protein